MRGKIIIALVIFIYSSSLAQDVHGHPQKVYKVRQKTEFTLSTILFTSGLLGVVNVSNKPTITLQKANALRIKDVPGFDRSAVKQSFPAPENVYNLTDIGLYGASAMVPLLLLDDDIREDWFDIGILFYLTQSINLNLYYWGGPSFNKRIRPIVYYEGTSDQIKTGPDMTDSFFSGHVSMTAGASFFIAKVYNDYHPELGWKKWLLYTAALIPPALVGYGRYRGLMHFPSDILTGLAVGATVGIMVPHLHKIAKESGSGFSLLPFAGEYNGLQLILRL